MPRGERSFERCFTSLLCNVLHFIGALQVSAYCSDTALIRIARSAFVDITQHPYLRWDLRGIVIDRVSDPLNGSTWYTEAAHVKCLTEVSNELKALGWHFTVIIAFAATKQVKMKYTVVNIALP